MQGFVRRCTVAVVALTASGAALTSTPAVVHADGPGAGTPWVVAMGDSYISGEAGRWAGNSNNSSASTDAGGSDAYFDNATRTAEVIAGCHRAPESAEVHIGSGANGSAVNSLNLACSGARTSSFVSDSEFKPGIDFYANGSLKGQALMLQEFAATNNVRMIVLSIGGNNFGFADIVQRCVTNFLTSPSWWPNYCYDDSSVSSNFSSTNITNQTNAIVGAINNIRAAMANAGYTTAQYSIVAQTYPSPIPRSSGFRYSQSGYTRQSTGGCGFWNRDADWANDVALVRINGAVTSAAATTGVPVLNLASAFNGRRLCETGVNLMENTGLGNWSHPNAANTTEWINQIRTLSTVFGPYQVQESIHPNWWGQRATRNCVRQAWNNGAPRGGVCTRGALGLNTRGEPNMVLS
jgi:hypothetical protein